MVPRRQHSGMMALRVVLAPTFACVVWTSCARNSSTTANDHSPQPIVGTQTQASIVERIRTAFGASAAEETYVVDRSPRTGPLQATVQHRGKPTAGWAKLGAEETRHNTEAYARIIGRLRTATVQSTNRDLREAAGWMEK